uniref:C2H2-type domain-containing protein n=1 Tax=Strigamia maritima TaxID=126957 RepID=T1JL48_STRMM
TKTPVDYVCSVCAKQFSSRTSLHNHKNVHRERFKCDVCGHCSESNASLKKHQHTHIPVAMRLVRKHVCHLCPKRFLSRSSLNHHFYVHEERYKCIVCGYCCESQARLQRHLKSHNQGKSRLKELNIISNSTLVFAVICALRLFCWKSGLQYHMNVHLERFKCNICGKCWESNALLQQHLQTHLPPTLRQKHECPLCQKEFNTAALVAFRLRANRNSSRIHCDQCGTAFTTTYALHKHQNIHLGKFKCDVCGHCSDCNANLAKHKSIHGGNIHVCRVCNLHFRSFKGLSDHSRTHDFNAGRRE